MIHEIEFDRRTDMAWYVLRPFINPLDCSQKVGSAWLPMNKSEALERLYNRVPSGDGRCYRPSYFSKSRLFFHLSRSETYGFRCRYDAVAQIGFGSYDKAKDRLGFADDLGIEGKLRRFPETGVILLGIDIDAHHGEDDAPKVRDMLLDLFPSSYSEPSTGGKGFHFYLKLAYPRHLSGSAGNTLRYVHRVMADFGNLLDRRRIEKGLKAPIDKVRGLPSLVRVDDDGRIRIQNRSHCIKIPRFEAGEDAIRRFHRAPYVRFGVIDQMVSSQKALDLIETIQGDDAGGHLESFLETEPVAFLSQPQVQERSGGGLCSNSVVSSGYDHHVGRLRGESDAYERSWGLATAYARHLRRPATLEELLLEYERQQLNTEGDDDGNRRRRFTFICQHVAKTFDIRKAGFKYDGFDDMRSECEEAVLRRLTPSTALTYRHRGERPISVEELARAYFALLRSSGDAGRTAFSGKQLVEAFRQMTGTGIGKPKRDRIFALLRDELQLIRRVGGYIPGVRGLVWEVLRPESLRSVPSMTATS